jgi:hypothetical protein
MCANSTGRAQAFLSASDAVVSQEVADHKISIQSACALNPRYFPVTSRVQVLPEQFCWVPKHVLFNFLQSVIAL